MGPRPRAKPHTPGYRTELSDGWTCRWTPVVATDAWPSGVPSEAKQPLSVPQRSPALRRERGRDETSHAIAAGCVWPDATIIGSM